MTHLPSGKAGTDPSRRHEQLLRFLEGSLAPQEEARLSAQLARDAQLQQELRTLSTLRETIEPATGATFDSGFPQRVMKRLPSAASASETLGSFHEALPWAFLRVAVVALLLTAGLGAYNAGTHLQMDGEASLVEAVLGLPDVSMETALAYDIFEAADD